MKTPAGGNPGRDGGYMLLKPGECLPSYSIFQQIPILLVDLRMFITRGLDVRGLFHDQVSLMKLTSIRVSIQAESPLA